MVAQTFCFCFDCYKTIYYYEVGHVDYKHQHRQSEIVDIASSDTLAIKNTVMIRPINADIAQFAVLSIPRQVHLTLIA